MRHTRGPNYTTRETGRTLCIKQMNRNENTTVESLQQNLNHPAEPGTEHLRSHPDGERHTNTRSAPPRLRAKARIAVLLVGALLVCAASAGYYIRFVAPYESTDNAFIEGNVISMASQVPGRVAELLVKDNQAVKQGDVLLKIDPRDYEASQAQARADLEASHSRVEQANAQVKASEAKVAHAQATVIAAEAENQRAADDLKRYQSVESRAVSKSALDMAQSQSRAAGANLDAARSQVKAADAEVALSAAGVKTASASVQQAEARLRQAELNLSYTQLTAPEDGRVTRRVVEKGAYVQPGQTLLAIVPSQYWVVANFKEIQLTHMRAGQPAEIVVEAYPGRAFKGHVESIQAGSGARFSMFPPENATGNYVKVVQRVPVKIVIEDVLDADFVLGPGMSVFPEVRVK